MKNIKLIYLAVGLVAFSAPQLTRGEDPKPAAAPSREELREKFKNMTPEEREAARKEYREKNPENAAAMEKRAEDMKKMWKDLGLNEEEVRKLPVEERMSKIKEASEKKTAELEKKKTAGTITDSEKEILQRLEQRKKFMEGRRGDGTPGRPRRPAAEKPVEKPVEKN